MLHLTLEALARLVDEAPEPHEQAHLAGCEECRDELEALREQTAALGTLPSLMPPPEAWPGLRKRLRAEGLIRGRIERRWTGSALTRVAAAVVLFVAGGAAGYGARGTVAAPAGEMTAEAPASGSAAGTALAGGPETAAPEGESEATLSEDVERTEEMFAAALDRFMRASGTEAPDPATRLATLDNIVLTTAEALNESPADPVINSYHMTAVAQRRELIRQLTASGEPVF